MKTLNSILSNVLLVSLTAMLISWNPPEDWQKAGTQRDSYFMGIDNDVKRLGNEVYTLKSIDKKIDGFGTATQKSLPDEYLGKRVRMTGYVMTNNVSDWAGLWLRVDTKNPDKIFSLDNMHDRAIKGTTDWRKYELVADVPKNASALIYGVLLDGTGQVWFDDVKFEIVDETVPTTGRRTN